MAHTFLCYCPHCGTPMQENMHRCPTCLQPPPTVTSKAMPLRATIATTHAKLEKSPARLTVPLIRYTSHKRRVALLLVLLALLCVLGTGGYFVFFGWYFVQAPIRSVSLHIPLTYAGLNITLLNAQQAQNFLDDPYTVNTGMVRLHLQERNITTSLITWNYTQSARLLVPGQPALAPVYVRSAGKAAPGATQTSLLDFAVPDDTPIRSMGFQLGLPDEAQLLIPFISQANLSQYQPQTLPQQRSTIYFGLRWLLTSSTTSLSIPDQQATKGMEFLTFTMIINNMLSQKTITGSPFDYARVKIAGNTFSPVDTTLPVSFASGRMGNTGTLTFLIPQKSTSGTFLLLPQDPDGNGQASVHFSLAQST